MKKYKAGTKFIVCGHDELLKKGWEYSSDKYLHDDFSGCHINGSMIEDYEGQILTTNEKSSRDDWYHVDEESFWIWPVATFSEAAEVLTSDHTCEEGMTTIGGWFICKTCGDNLREINS